MVQHGGKIRPLEVRLSEEQGKIIDSFTSFLSALNKKNNTKDRYRYSLLRFLEVAGKSFNFNEATEIKRFEGIWFFDMNN